jgi:hypothetical protein
MQEDKDPSPEYIIGFNQGYYFKQHIPDLLESIISTKNEANERIKGLKAGKMQFEREQILEQLRLAKKQTKSNEKER